MSKVEVLRTQAATLGGSSLKPKPTAGRTSCAFAFRDLNAARKLVEFASAQGFEAGIRSTYRAWLVTAMV